MKCCETVLNILVFSLKRKGADAEESRFEVWKMKIDNVTSVGEILSLEGRKNQTCTRRPLKFV